MAKKGVLHIRILRRIPNTRNPIRIDKWVLYSWVDKNTGKKYFRIFSQYQGLQTFDIIRHEVAFIKLLFHHFKDGDYAIQVWGKGKKNKGFRIFWDGMIFPNRTFIRRRKSLFNLEGNVLKRAGNFAKHPDYFIGHYMRTKPSGKRYEF